MTLVRRYSPIVVGAFLFSDNDLNSDATLETNGMDTLVKDSNEQTTNTVSIVTATPKGRLAAALLTDKTALAALLVVIAYLTAAVVCEISAFRHKINHTTPSYEKGNLDERYQPPSTTHWMGTDYQGRDVFWRGVHAIRTAVKVGVIASLLSSAIGVALGVSAGYFGGWIDDLVVWIYSTFASIPTLLFILAFALLVSKGFLLPPLAEGFAAVSRMLNSDPGMMAVYLGIGLTGWVSLCRVTRAEAAKIRQLPYVQAAKATGLGSMRIIRRHVIPNLFHLVIVYFTMRFAFAIMTEVIVSYLGLGVQLQPSWGTMIADGQERLWQGIWWEVGAATFFMFFLVLSLHLLGDALRDVLDPKLRS